MDPAKMDLPEPALYTQEVYGQRHPIFDAKATAREYSGFPIERLKAGEIQWQMEIKHVDVPYLARYIATDVFPHPMIWNMHMVPNGTLWAVAYPYMLTDRGTAEMQPMFMTSVDNGETFQCEAAFPTSRCPSMTGTPRAAPAFRSRKSLSCRMALSFA